MIYVAVVFTLSSSIPSLFVFFFFFNDTATTEIYTLSLHDALPILRAALDERRPAAVAGPRHGLARRGKHRQHVVSDRKSTRLNSSHLGISYAVFCLKKKKKQKKIQNKQK